LNRPASDQSKPPESTDIRIAAALRDYRERLDRGEAVNREEFLALHAENAGELRSLLAAEVEARNLPRAAENAKNRSTDHLDRLTPDQRAIVEEQVQPFKEAWLRSERPAIAQYLPKDAAVRSAALIEIVHLDLKCRFEAGEPRQLAS